MSHHDQAHTMEASQALIKAKAPSRISLNQQGPCKAIHQAPFSVAERASGVPCSWNQEQMLYLQMQLPNKCTYSAPRGVTLQGHLNQDALQKAVDMLIARHEALRTGFCMRDGTPLQFVVAAEDVSSHLAVCELPELSHPIVQAALQKEAMHPFDLSQPPLLRVVLARVRFQIPRVPALKNNFALLTMHHLLLRLLMT